MEKPLKVFWNGKHLRDIYPHATRWEVFKFKVKRFFRKCVIVTVSILVIWLACIIYSKVNPSIIYTKAEVIKEVEVKAPVLDRIAKCESGGNHYRNGQVIVNGNKNGSVDVGKYQINSLWFKKATEMGLNLTVEEDNTKFATYLYKTYGTEPWIWTKSCWNK